MKRPLNLFRIKAISLLTVLLCAGNIHAQTWADSIDVYGREVFMPADQYKWDWGQATMMNAMVHLYNVKPELQKRIYLNYVKTAMDKTYNDANGLHPNAVASGHGMAFLARITGDPKYKEKADKIYADYLTTPRTKAGGVSHRTETIELWDDTVYMLSMYLLEMYRYTGDEKYLKEFHDQFLLHKEKLADKKWGLWVHGYDDDNDDYKDRCCQLNWAQMTPQRNSIEFWGRGNGWVVMAIADALKTVPANSPYFKTFARELREITKKLPSLQDKETGMWYQLPIYPDNNDNFQESSCTAMFAYGLAIGIDLKILDRNQFMPVVEKAYSGLKKYACRTEDNYVIPTKVCEGTCIGDRAYYFGRKTKEGVNYAIGAYIMLGLELEELKKKH
ncbi:MAG: glycoside hydrolase family 88 protein [Prolixibacteraceae bacterium]|nr:glycoside hydrolase family 88 protein [Prolixibacteraceae bacterium]